MNEIKQENELVINFFQKANVKGSNLLFLVIAHWLKVFHSTNRFVFITPTFLMMYPLKLIGILAEIN